MTESQPPLVWAWPTDDFAVVSLDASALVRVNNDRGQWLAAFNLAPATPVHAAPAPTAWLYTGEFAMLARAHYLACRHLRLPHAWVRPASHTFSPGTLIAARDASQSAAGDVLSLAGFCEVPPVGGITSADALPYVLLDYAFGGVGRPHLQMVQGGVVHTGLLDVHVPAALGGEHWKSLLIENPTVKVYAEGIAAIARRWGSEAIPLRARILRDEAWVNASVHRGTLRDLARMITDSMQALANLFNH